MKRTNQYAAKEESDLEQKLRSRGGLDAKVGPLLDCLPLMPFQTAPLHVYLSQLTVLCLHLHTFSPDLLTLCTRHLMIERLTMHQSC